MTNRLRKYIRDLLLLGIVGVFSGGFFMNIIFQPNFYQGLSIYYIPIKILGVFWVYKLINKIAPGGNVNVYWGMNHEPNHDEILLNRIIAKYSNKTLVAISAVMYLLIDGFIGLPRYSTDLSIGFDGIFTFLFAIPFIIVGAMMNGVKYTSAWWNIRKILQKDPTGEKLIMSVKNDPELIKLDNPKPLIDLPKLFRNTINKIFGNKN